MLYAIKQKNFHLLKCLLQLKPNILNEYISDELDVINKHFTYFINFLLLLKF
jgi:hypothetical protein